MNTNTADKASNANLELDEPLKDVDTDSNSNQKTFKIKITKHPDEKKYPGVACEESRYALTKLMLKLEPQEISDLYSNDLLLDEEKAIETFDTMQKGDVWGMALMHKSHGFILSTFELTSDNIDDVFDAHDKVNKEDVEISLNDVSVAVHTDLIQLLYRDGEPFGIKKEIEMSIDLDSFNGQGFKGNITNPKKDLEEEK
jgi:hypothetical protein